MGRPLLAARLRLACALLLGAALAAGCGKKKTSAADAAVAASAVDAAASAVASAAPAPDAAALPPKLPPLTQEQVQKQAAAAVEEASNEAKQKKPDCDKIVDKLDTAFDIVAPAMGDSDRPVFVVYASCAKKLERWRLLQQVAQAMIDGDAGFKSSWQLTRALVGLGQYDVAARLGASILRSWPKEGETYTTAALASSRIEDWKTVAKQADQALLVQRQHGISDEISAQGHVFKALSLLHQGKIDESSHELDAANAISAGGEIDKLRAANDVVKSSGLIADVDLTDAVYLGLAHLYPKNQPNLGAVATFRLYNVGDKPQLQVRVEVTLSDVAEPIGKAVTVIRGARQVLKLTPPFRADLKPASVKDPKPADLGYKITLVSDGSTLYEGSIKTTLQPVDRIPISVTAHGTDHKPARELEAAWVTPSAAQVAALIDAAKKRAPGGQFAGAQGETFPQVQALWDELRGRGAAFVRDPAVDAEGPRSVSARLPADVLAAGRGNALEGTLVFASLFEAVGLDVVLVHVPGNAFVGWLPSKADRGTAAMKNAVQSPLGKAFFLETTTVGEAPPDAAMLRGDAEFVERMTGGAFGDGRATALSLSKLRKAGIVPQP